MRSIMSRFWADEAGATMLEYGTLAALIAVVVALAVSAFGETVRDRLFQSSVRQFP